MRAVADHFFFVAGFELEENCPAVHVENRRFRFGAHADGRRGDVAHVEHGAQALVARGQ